MRKPRIKEIKYLNKELYGYRRVRISSGETGKPFTELRCYKEFHRGQQVCIYVLWGLFILIKRKQIPCFYEVCRIIASFCGVNHRHTYINVIKQKKSGYSPVHFAFFERVTGMEFIELYVLGRDFARAAGLNTEDKLTYTKLAAKYDEYYNLKKEAEDKKAIEVKKDKDFLNSLPF